MHLAMHPIAEASVFGSHVPEGLMIECRSDIHADKQLLKENRSHRYRCRDGDGMAEIIVIVYERVDK